MKFVTVFPIIKYGNNILDKPLDSRHILFPMGHGLQIGLQQSDLQPTLLYN